MINALKLCSLALNPASPNPTATMVKVDDGFMTSYGGKFAIRVPVTQIIGAAFNPKSLATFFRKPRTLPAYTIKFPKLTISEGRERLTINCLPAEDVITIDNIETPVPCTLNLANAKRAAELALNEAPQGREFALGVTFRDGAAYSTNNYVFFCGQSDLPEDFNFTLDKEAVLALSKFKSPVVAVSKNDHTVKFIFKSGASLCAHIIDAPLPEISHLFESEWKDFKILEDLKEVKCDEVEIRQGSLFYHSQDSVGELENAVEGDVELRTTKDSIDCLLGGDLSFNGTRLRSIGSDWAIIASVMHL